MSFDDKGISVERFPEILEGIQSQQLAKANSGLKFSQNKILNALNSIYALSLHQLSELIEASYDSTRISSANGFHLEEIALSRGVSRISASRSFTPSQYCVMAPGKSIPAGSLFRASTSSVEASNEFRITADPKACNSVSVKISTDANSTLYQVRVNGFTYSFTSSFDTNPQEIRDGLVSEFTQDTNKTFSVSTEDDNTFTLTDTSNNTLSFETLTTYIKVVSVKVYFTLRCVETGEVAVEASTMDTLLSSVDGLLETLNDEDFIPGRDKEIDSALRLRIQNQGNPSGVGTIPTIKSTMLANVSGVGTVEVIENSNVWPFDAEGRPKGSYEVIVVGGEDLEVAQEVERTRPVSTQLFGNTTVPVTDSSGSPRIVSFTRPTPVHLAVDIAYSLYNEEDLPPTALDDIQTAVFEYINSLALNKDFIPQRLFGPIYSAAVAGVGTVEVRGQAILTPGEVPNSGDWSEDRLSITASEYASIAYQDIYLRQV